MSSPGVVCCLYDHFTKFERIKLSSISLNDTISNLKGEISRLTTISTDELQIIHCGRLLSDTDTLQACGVKAGVTLHALRKTEKENNITSSEKADCSEVGLQSLTLALKAAVRHPAFRSTVRKLSKPDVMENIIAATPDLANDPIAIAILHDPDLLMQFTDIATIRRAVEVHPTLTEAIYHVVAAVQEEGGGLGASASSARLPQFLNLFWDMASDDEDFSQADQASSSDTSQTPSQQDPASFPAITPAQLASALAAVATAGTITMPAGSNVDAGPSVLPRPTIARNDVTPSQSTSSIITSELFNQAMQQAISSTTLSQLQQLRDMGITDDAASLRALQITQGNVQAALELIFGEGLGENNCD